VTHHAEGLSRLIDDSVLIETIKKDYRRADLDAADRAMLDFSVKLTKTPCGCERADVERLRAHGLTDADIHDIVQTVAYYAFVNRMACGLGVELEPYWEDADNR